MIPEVLNLKTFKDEFTHTMLHGRDVFADLKAAKSKKEGKAGPLDAKIEELKHSDYTPSGISKS